MRTRSLVALGALNFFMADVRDGLGPFLGVYLQARDWSPAQIGTVMTIGGLAAMAATTRSPHPPTDKLPCHSN